MMCSLNRLNRTRATCSGAAMGQLMLWIDASHRMASGRQSRSSEHAGGLPLAGAYTTKPWLHMVVLKFPWRKRTSLRGLLGKSPHVITGKHTTKWRPRLNPGLLRTGPRHHERLWCSAEVQKATMRLTSTTIPAGSPKERSGFCAVCDSLAQQALS